MTDETVTEETAPQKEEKKRGRPAKPTGSKVDLKFHLVLLKEEMDLFKAAAEAEGLHSTSIFIRAAIDQAGENPASIRKHIPKGLAPAAEDKTTKHYPLLLSAASRAIINREDARGHSEFIRAAALSRVFGAKIKSQDVEAAIEALKLVKGAK